MDDKDKDGATVASKLSGFIQTLRAIDGVNQNAVKSAVDSLALKEASKIVDSFRKTLTINLSESMRAFAESLEREKPKIIERLMQVAQTIQDVNRDLAVAAVIMNNNGWWLVGCMDAVFFRRLPEYEAQVTPDALTKIIVDSVNSDECGDLTDIVNAWTLPSYEARKAIFQDALWAHKEGKYTLTVPTLVVQVEGIIREFISSEDSFTSYRFPAIKARFDQKFIQITHTTTNPTLVTPEQLQGIINYYNLAALERLFTNYQPDAHVEPADINRHAASHGLWINYGTIEHSTKLFLLLDMLYSMLQQLSTTPSVTS